MYNTQEYIGPTAVPHVLDADSVFLRRRSSTSVTGTTSGSGSTRRCCDPNPPREQT